MAGHPGTSRFGTFPAQDTDTNDDTGMSLLHTRDGDVKEYHTVLNRGSAARDMGTSEGDAPNQCYEYQERLSEFPANHDGFSGGNLHNSTMDEKKVLDNYIANVKVEYSDEQQDISGTRGKFD